MMIAMLALMGCREPDFGPIGETVGTGVSIGWSAAVAARANRPDSPACVDADFSGACVDDPCVGTVVIDLSDPECAFPLGDSTTGTVEAAGTWTGDEALLALRFLDVSVDGGTLYASGISAVTARVDDAEGAYVEVGFIDQDIEGIDVGGETSDELGVGQSGWGMGVDLSDGPAAYRMELNGGGQRVDTSSGRSNSRADVVQLAAVRTIMDASCRQNPIDGVVTLQKAAADGAAGAADTAITGVTFDETCDGQAKLEASLGLDIANSQKSFPLDLWQR
jgi:hypothetical protein